MDAKGAVEALLQCAHERHIKLVKTQIVKMLYLAELEYVRETGKRLTSLDWIFYYHGPYCFELEHILTDETIFRQQKLMRNGKKCYLFSISSSGNSLRQRTADPIALEIFQHIVATWGRKPLRQLVDYVYLHTEPMQKAVMRGDILDFSSSNGKKEQQ